jgi:plasmid maintenance system antidote protein VapI
MSTNAKAVFDQLRDFIQEEGLNLTVLSKNIGIPYHRLWRFRNNEKSLSMEDAEKLFVHFTGATFILTSNDI